MILATVITNFVMALMVREANVTLDSDGDFRVSSVKTQYINSVTLHEFDSLGVRNCKMCNKQIFLTPIDYLWLKPLTMQFKAYELDQSEYNRDCQPWIYLNQEMNNMWLRITNTNKESE